MVPEFLGKAIKIDLHRSSGILPESYMILANSSDNEEFEGNWQ